jgi:hypothetical protein
MMKNINYDLLELLHAKLDTAWRLEHHFIQDAQEAKCHSLEALQQILKDEKKHIEMLRDEIRRRVDAGVFI